MTPSTRSIATPTCQSKSCYGRPTRAFSPLLCVTATCSRSRRRPSIGSHYQTLNSLLFDVAQARITMWDGRVAPTAASRPSAVIDWKTLELRRGDGES